MVHLKPRPQEWQGSPRSARTRVSSSLCTMGSPSPLPQQKQQQIQRSGTNQPFPLPAQRSHHQAGASCTSPTQCPSGRELLFPHLPGSPVLELAGRTSTPGWWWAPPAPAEPPARCLLPAGTCRRSPCWDLGRRGQRLKEPPCAQPPPAWDQLADIPVPVTGIAVYGPVPPCAAWFMYTLCMGEPSTEPAGLKVPGKLVGPEGW